MFIPWLDVLCLLIACHCLADYPLQGEFLAKAKNRFDPIPGVPWYQAMSAHCIIHGLFVGLITQSIALGFGEVILHFVTDYKKCKKEIFYNGDQAIHVGAKVVWSLSVFSPHWFNWSIIHH